MPYFISQVFTRCPGYQRHRSRPQNEFPTLQARQTSKRSTGAPPSEGCCCTAPSPVLTAWHPSISQHHKNCCLLLGGMGQWWPGLPETLCYDPWQLRNLPVWTMDHRPSSQSWHKGCATKNSPTSLHCVYWASSMLYKDAGVRACVGKFMPQNWLFILNTFTWILLVLCS